MNDPTWPFQEPPNVATFTLRGILRKDVPILAVFHNDDDGAWQFLDGSDSPDPKEAAVVALSEMAKLDPTICELHDLPLGWCAWRPNRAAPWRREPCPFSDDAGEST